MSENNNNSKIEVNETEYKALLKKVEDLSGEVSKLSSHNEELFKETKKAKEAAREKAKEKEDLLKSSGDYEQLFKTTDAKRKELEDKLNNLYNERAHEKIKAEAIKLASSQGMADGDNVELLAHFVEQRLKYTEDGIKVLDPKGNLTVSSLDDLKNEFLKNSKFASLLTATKASGGGATGSRSGASKITMKRSDFDQMKPVQQSEYAAKIRNGEANLVD